MCVPGFDWACDLAGDAATAAAGSVLNATAHSFGDAANSVLQAVNSVIDATTAIDLDAPWFRSNVGLVTAIVLPIIAGLFVLQVIGGVIRKEPGALGRALWGLVKSLVFSAAAITIAQSLIVATDQMSAGVADAAGTSIKDAFSRFLLGSVLSGLGAALEIVMAILLIIGALVVWGTLLLRKAAVLVVGVFAPVAFAGSAHERTSVWTRRWIETMVALIVTKLVMVIVFVLGASAFGQAGGGGEDTGATLSDLLTGVLLIFMTALTPVASYKFLHWAEMQVASHMHGVMSSSGALPHARSAVSRGARMAMSMGTGGIGGAAMAAAPAMGGTPTGGAGASSTTGGRNAGGGSGGSGAGSSGPAFGGTGRGTGAGGGTDTRAPVAAGRTGATTPAAAAPPAADSTPRPSPSDTPRPTPGGWGTRTPDGQPLGGTSPA